MPINDQLVKMTRSGPDTWETVSLLPVSFSSLVMPDPKHPPPTVTLRESVFFSVIVFVVYHFLFSSGAYHLSVGDILNI